LDENVVHDILLIHGTPTVMLHALEPDEHILNICHLLALPIGKASREFPEPVGRIGRLLTDSA
jgi:hypothetical protein